MNDSLTQQFARWAVALETDAIPGAVVETLRAGLLDYAGLCIAARHQPYVHATLASWDGDGGCTVLGHARGLGAAGAAFVNGTAAHGEDYDDTFEGTPVHTGAVLFPAVLAAAERDRLGGADALRGIAVGSELMCRLALVAPTAIHRAGFHPTAVIGALGAAAGVGAALRLTAAQLTDALGVAGSLASGIIEYLAEGTWTKRLHAGWAAQSGLRAALLGRHGFAGPRTVLEGRHGFFHAFADHATAPDFSRVTERLGETWHAGKIAFKPYACGTMAQPFIDCAITLAGRGVDPQAIEAIECRVGEGTVHRLWEPLAEKRCPTTPYSAKFSVPYCIAVALLDRAAGLGQFTGARVAGDDVRALAARIGYRVDPDDEYPRNYSGHLRVTMRDGALHEVRQPHLRGGAREPLSDAEMVAKYRANMAFGGWSDGESERLAALCQGLFEADGVASLAAFRP